eukprot:gnl/TRDRNA2_/TRDRNA2_175732_c0_seq2.p1 gnl/TRDRNA2_/TRDRNA2_175732_c0~~gnl/TRDRNA2_/TRDRNA2_175732_c0_seq2.p1  ORF type:complete len:475 (+),score=53.01 gnl/TRDRNA2_/TRDRNA2_175732_c0_seq2:1-1425(+)
MDWIKSQEWSNGDVYSIGASADGINSLMEVIAGAPLKGQWVVWASGQGHSMAFPGGAFRHDLLYNYLFIMDIPMRGSGLKFVLPELYEHEAWGDFWVNRTMCREKLNPTDPSCHYKNIKWPVLTLAAWWDIFSQDTLNYFDGARKASDVSVRDDHVLIVGPLGHCSLWPVNNPSDMEAEFAANQVGYALSKDMFAGNTHGKARSKVGRVNLYIQGGFGLFFDAPGRYWTSLDDWPKPTSTPLYLQENGALSDAYSQKNGTVGYAYDPKDATPMLGGNNIPVCSRIKECAYADQFEREQRKDVVLFDSQPLEEEMAIVGKISATLFVSSDAKDTDFVVTVSDLHPDKEKSMLVRFGIQRMRFRESDAVQSPPLISGKVYEVSIDLLSTAYIFPKGHHIRVSVASAADPYFAPNSNTGKNELADTSVIPVIAHNKVHFSAEQPSRILLPVVPQEAIPENPDFKKAYIPEISDRIYV